MWRILRHLLFWSIILFWTNTVYTNKGGYGWPFLQFNLVRLPLMMAATYTLLYYLLPTFIFKERRYIMFGVTFSVLFVATTLLDRWLIGSSLIDGILKDTGLTYTFFNEIPLFRNAFLLLSIMGLALIVRLFNFYEQTNELALSPSSSLNTIEEIVPSKNKPVKTTSTDDFLVKSGSITHQLNWKDVLFLEKDENYVIYHTKEKRILQRTTLSNLIPNLPSHFCRTHRSFIVALPQITQVERDSLIIKSQKIPIGRTYRANFLDQLANFNHA